MVCPGRRVLAWTLRVKRHPHPLRQREVRVLLPGGEVLKNLPLDRRNGRRVDGGMARKRGAALRQILLPVIGGGLYSGQLRIDPEQVAGGGAEVHRLPADPRRL